MEDSRCVTALVSENRVDTMLVFVMLSFVGGRLVELVSGHPRPSLSGTGVPWVSFAGTHRCATGVQDDSGAKRQQFFVWLLVLLES